MILGEIKCERFILTLVNTISSQLNIRLFLRSPATSMNSNKHLYVADLAQNGYSLRELEGRVRIGRQYK